MKYLYLCHKGNGLKPDQALMKSISRGDKDNQSQNNKSFKSNWQFFSQLQRQNVSMQPMETKSYSIVQLDILEHLE